MAEPRVRMRYPIHAVLLLGVCWLLYALVLIVSSLLILPCVPLAPALVVLMIALGGLLSSVHDYARSVATPVQRVRLGRLAEVTKVAQASRAPRHA